MSKLSRAEGQDRRPTPSKAHRLSWSMRSQRWSAEGVALAGMALPVALTSALGAIGQATGTAQLWALAPLLGMLALTPLILHAEARRLARLDLLSAAVVAYTLANLGALLANPTLAAPPEKYAA
ncbi:MAG TPA: hypothetical protein VKQ36_04260, partial [Ktedonobacterales bacterium]|nr:hypothetical protein [Ktedonobacterales bacterium]